MLSEDERWELWNAHGVDEMSQKEADAFARAIEAAVLEKMQAQSEPVNWNWVDLQNRADEIVRGKVLWKRFIDGTPLANDIACWMADFAQEVAAAPVQQEPKCSTHPKAPHGFDRNGSHNAGRYVCECEGWDAYSAGYQAGIDAALRSDE